MGSPITPLGRPDEPSSGPVLLPKEFPPKQILERDRLTRTAERLGEAAAALVGSVRGIPERLRAVNTRLAVARSRVRERASGVDDIQRGNFARRSAKLARVHVEQFAGQRPFQLIAGAAGAAFVVGFALRWRRSNHARTWK